MKTVSAAVGIRRAGADFESSKRAIDYALHFPDYVRYTEGGHGQVIDEIKTALLANHNQEDQRELSLRLARYAIEKAESIAENFEDDWDWTSSLNDLKKWIENKNEA